MASNAGRMSTGSSSREYEILFEIAPPTETRPSAPFHLPVIVSVRPVDKMLRQDPTQQLVAHASLRDETGSTSVPGLTGTLTSSVRSRSGNINSGFARFDPLILTHPGPYRLRIILGAASLSGVSMSGYIDSEVITVHKDAITQRPTPGQIMKLEGLIPENIDIWPEDIAEWRERI